MVAVICTLGVGFIAPYRVNNAFAKDIYGVGISVLSIVFSVYFAALAIIISSSDDSFIMFLEEEGDYTALISSFKFSLSILFFALLYSLIIFSVTSAWIVQECKMQSFWYLVGFSLLFLWGLFAAFNATRDSIMYAQYRARFLKIKKQNLKKDITND
jgi:glucan phosphoethanolaminetransferase (alkaline phosphatase superfamily)